MRTIGSYELAWPSLGWIIGGLLVHRYAAYVRALPADPRAHPIPHIGARLVAAIALLASVIAWALVAWVAWISIRLGVTTLLVGIPWLYVAYVFARAQRMRRVIRPGSEHVITGSLQLGAGELTPARDALVAKGRVELDVRGVKVLIPEGTYRSPRRARDARGFLGARRRADHPVVARG